MHLLSDHNHWYSINLMLAIAFYLSRCGFPEPLPHSPTKIQHLINNKFPLASHNHEPRKQGGWKGKEIAVEPTIISDAIFADQTSVIIAHDSFASRFPQEVLG